MLEKPLLLSGAKLGVLGSNFSFSLSRLLVLGIGLLVVAVGGSDVSARLVNLAGSNALSTAFAPAIAITDFASFVTPPMPLIPLRIRIPVIGVEAKVEQVGVRDDGAMANPSSFATTGWYKFGGKPGGAGNAVIAGHVNNALGLSGVFARLSDVSIGDSIFVSDSTGTTLTYTVHAKTQYTAANAPLEEIFRTTGPSQLVLITCEGDWDPKSRSYDKRLVVVARLVP